MKPTCTARACHRCPNCIASAVALAALVVGRLRQGARRRRPRPRPSADVAALGADRTRRRRAHGGRSRHRLAASRQRRRDRRRLRRRARAENKPVFVYWGAKWCPPCNQVKATLFNRQDFIERSRAFVPVYVDGDSPGAQKLGARFQRQRLSDDGAVQPAGRGSDAAARRGRRRCATREVLTLGMNAARPVKRGARRRARRRRPRSAPNDWRLLAFYSWDTDQQQLIAKDELPATLLALADACPADAADERDAAAPEGAGRRRREGAGAGRRGDARGACSRCSATRRARASRPTC